MAWNSPSSTPAGARQTPWTATEPEAAVECPICYERCPLSDLKKYGMCRDCAQEGYDHGDPKRDGI